MCTPIVGKHFLWQHILRVCLCGVCAIINTTRIALRALRTCLFRVWICISPYKLLARNYDRPDVLGHVLRSYYTIQKCMSFGLSSHPCNVSPPSPDQITKSVNEFDRLISPDSFKTHYSKSSATSAY